MQKLIEQHKTDKLPATANELFSEIHTQWNALLDVDKHYQRKENLLFPFLEKKGVTGPPTVMWGKHDEARDLLKNALEALSATDNISAEEAMTVIDLALKPAAKAVEEMIYKEEEFLFPMCLDKLTDAESYQIYQQSTEIGYCLYDPQEKWQPAFWINMGGRFIHIEYFALRDDQGKYLGTLEVSQDLTEKRKLQAEQRLLSYAH